VHLMLENEANQASRLERCNGHIKLYNGQWGDDFHNALHVLLTGEIEGYYRAFADKPLEHLARSLTEGFAYQGEVFPLNGKPRGEPSAHLPPEATIFFAQNHDQVGNRAFGERLAKLVGGDKLRQAMILLILNPHVPLLFMGEEAAAETPFLFFADWKGEAANMTREGRRKEFAHFTAFSTPEMRNKIPDPADEKTFLASKLDWEFIEHAPTSIDFRKLTQGLLRIRQERIVPLITQGFVTADADLIGGGATKCGLDVRWQTASRHCLQIVTNFGDQRVPKPDLIEGETLWSSHPSYDQFVQPAEIIVRLGSAPAPHSFRRSQRREKAPKMG
jgi:maltooligosyltrehalose trehalohydrolase